MIDWKRIARQNGMSFKEFSKEIKDTSDKKEWQGPQDGLPPVGTVCEVLCPDDEWHKTFIVGTDDDGYTVFTAHESPDFYKYGGTRDVAAFRPLCTEREKWIERAADVVAKCFHDGGALPSMQLSDDDAMAYCTAIYDNMIKDAE